MATSKEMKRSMWYELFMADGKYRKVFVYGLIIVGLVFGVTITDFSKWDQVAFFVTAYVLGVPCVISLGDREGFWGNVLGLLSNVGEVIINLRFGVIGMATSGLYFGATHVVGLFRNRKESNRDEEGKMKITTLEGSQAAITLIFMVLGVVGMLFFGQYLGFERDVTSVFYWLNIATFIISILSQYLMIMGKQVAWYGWGTSNVINFIINGLAGNYWFMFRDVLYQLNTVRSIYIWKDAEKREK